MENQVSLLIQAAVKLGADNASIISVKDIPFKREFRVACEQNLCGNYGRCWMCPPDVGDIDEMIYRAKSYTNALIFQTIAQLEDSFDIEGMEAAAVQHCNLTHTIAEELAPSLENILKLGAGGCHICERCAKLDDTTCRNPKKAMASLESYGIAVSELAKLCGMKYLNGQNTVTYFGGVLF